MKRVSMLNVDFARRATLRRLTVERHRAPLREHFARGGRQTLGVAALIVASLVTLHHIGVVHERNVLRERLCQTEIAKELATRPKLAAGLLLPNGSCVARDALFSALNLPR